MPELAVSTDMLSAFRAEEEKIFRIQTSLQQILDDALQVDNAQMGNLQLLNRRLGGLEIFVQKGFPAAFLELFSLVREDDPCVCGRAFRLGKRVVVRDITLDPYFASYLSVAHQAGFQSVQSTPILAPDQTVIGVISTHFPYPHLLTEQGKEALDACAVRAAQLFQK